MTAFLTPLCLIAGHDLNSRDQAVDPGNGRIVTPCRRCGKAVFHEYGYRPKQERGSP